MSQLISLRQRIKAVETIKKITHAMRLIAMSNHAQLKTRQTEVRDFCTQLINLYSLLRPKQQTAKQAKRLIIVIGVQKGLCGSFQHMVRHKALSFLKDIEFSLSKIDLIILGRKTVDAVIQKHKAKPLTVYHYWSHTDTRHIAQEIAEAIDQHHYSDVDVLWSHARNFMSQETTISKLIPLAPKQIDVHPKEQFVLEQPTEEVMGTLKKMYIAAQLELLMLNSNFAEQSARFLSMDNATRNAKEFLETATVQYNKFRQAKITKELSELTGGFY